MKFKSSPWFMGKCEDCGANRSVRFIAEGFFCLDCCPNSKWAEIRDSRREAAVDKRINWNNVV